MHGMENGDVPTQSDWRFSLERNSILTCMGSSCEAWLIPELRSYQFKRPSAYKAYSVNLICILPLNWTATNLSLRGLMPQEFLDNGIINKWMNEPPANRGSITCCNFQQLSGCIVVLITLLWWWPLAGGIRRLISYKNKQQLPKLLCAIDGIWATELFTLERYGQDQQLIWLSRKNNFVTT